MSKHTISKILIGAYNVRLVPNATEGIRFNFTKDKVSMFKIPQKSKQRIERYTGPNTEEAHMAFINSKIENII